MTDSKSAWSAGPPTNLYKNGPPTSISNNPVRTVNPLAKLSVLRQNTPNSSNTSPLNTITTSGNKFPTRPGAPKIAAVRPGLEMVMTPRGKMPKIVAEKVFGPGGNQGLVYPKNQNPNQNNPNNPNNPNSMGGYQNGQMRMPNQLWRPGNNNNKNNNYTPNMMNGMPNMMMMNGMPNMMMMNGMMRPMGPRINMGPGMNNNPRPMYQNINASGSPQQQWKEPPWAGGPRLPVNCNWKDPSANNTRPNMMSTAPPSTQPLNMNRPRPPNTSQPITRTMNPNQYQPRAQPARATAARAAAPAAGGKAGWPPGLTEYIQRCFAQCKSDMEKDATEKFLKTLINDKIKDGSARNINWVTEPLALEKMFPDRFPAKKNFINNNLSSGYNKRSITDRLSNNNNGPYDNNKKPKLDKQSLDHFLSDNKKNSRANRFAKENLAFLNPRGQHKSLVTTTRSTPLKLNLELEQLGLAKFKVNGTSTDIFKPYLRKRV